jgi:hypothetical protein
MQRQIIPQIFPEIFSLQFYPQQRDRAVQAALLACNMKSKQASLMQEVRGLVIESMTKTILKETISQQIIEARVIAQRKEKFRQNKAKEIKFKVLNQMTE